ncbi:hypothetical protein CAPTEDRAFT_162889 [Capitella teleta]|uniref:oleoyl-[acyl-carrier-protein] hydrolase n=1 Tax=Capitella teleta TaxID=283909 RepID=R7UST9_CAPTE|nr:hypothetical protein CAPTEDRAFT_162889 [Capitella teleta]|eukprot:ELU09544.1 hypothetical protein CAPTEDRAFT_162889 [Capitella teleta]
MSPSLQDNTSPWFNCLHQRPEAKCRLICFPWCGGGSQFYARWGKDFSKDVEVIGLCLPGRESRQSELLLMEFDRCVKILSEEIARLCSDKPFAFFAHSIGAALCFKTAEHLQEHFDQEPKHIFFSSSFAPHSQQIKDQVKDPEYTPPHELSNEDLTKCIAKMGGTPKLFLEDEDFMSRMFLPLYRADLKLMNGTKLLELNGKKPLSCPITVVEGNKDEDHRPKEFSDLTSGKFSHMTLNGGHFYLLKDDNCKRLKERIQKCIV